MSADCWSNYKLIALENTEALALDAANYNHLLNQQRLLRRREAQDWWLSLCRQPDKGANSSTHLISHGPEIHTDQHSCKRSSDMTSKQECLDDPVAVMNDGDICELSDLGHTEFTSPTKAHRSAALEQDCGKNIAVQSNIAPQILMILTAVFAGNSLQMREKIKNMSSLQNILHGVKHTKESDLDCC